MAHFVEALSSNDIVFWQMLVQADGGTQTNLMATYTGFDVCTSAAVNDFMFLNGCNGGFTLFGNHYIVNNCDENLFWREATPRV
jgi:hypothetical protein